MEKEDRQLRKFLKDNFWVDNGRIKFLWRNYLPDCSIRVRKLFLKILEEN